MFIREKTINNPSLQRGIKLKGSPKQNFLAVILLIIAIGSIGTLLWIYFHEKYLFGPDHLTANNNSVFIHFNRTLYQLNAAGELQDTIELSDLGIDGLITDIQLLSDGTILIGDVNKRCVRRCNVKSLSCKVIVPPNTIDLPFRFFADEPNRLLYLADSNHHRLLVQDMSGVNIHELAYRKIFFPNDIWVSDDGLIHIADTRNQRILTLEYKDNLVEEKGIISGNTHLARQGHIWPVAFARRPEGDWWVLNADDNLEYADLVVYDESRNPKRRISLPENADILSIAWAGKQILLTDLEHIQVYKVNPDTYSVDNFGDTKFQSELTDFRNRKKLYPIAFKSSLGILIFSLIGIVILIGHIILKDRKKSGITSKTIPIQLGSSTVKTQQILSWKNVLFLSFLGPLGAVLGQITFDILNNYTDGYLSSFFIELIKNPISSNFFSNFHMAISLFRWISGTGAVALSFAIVLQFKIRKRLFTFIVGCCIGLISWILTGYLIEAIPPDWTSILIKKPIIIPILTPYTIQSILPYILVSCLLSFAIREIRRHTFKMILAGFIGAIIGTILTLLYSISLFFVILEAIGNMSLYGINLYRIYDTFVEMFIFNFICLIFIKKSLKGSGSAIHVQ